MIGWCFALSLLSLALFLLCIGIILWGWYDDRRQKARLRKFDARVGRDIWKDIRGLTK